MTWFKLLLIVDTSSPAGCPMTKPSEPYCRINPLTAGAAYIRVLIFY